MLGSNPTFLFSEATLHCFIIIFKYLSTYPHYPQREKKKQKERKGCYYLFPLQTTPLNLTLTTFFVGNGKIDHTPTPVELRKIKRISFEVFLSLKELLNNFRPRFEKKTQHRDKRQIVTHKPETLECPHEQSYEPTNMAHAYDSLFWQWRRVAEWYRYINDPYENIKRTHDNLIE